MRYHYDFTLPTSSFYHIHPLFSHGLTTTSPPAYPLPPTPKRQSQPTSTSHQLSPFLTLYPASPHRPFNDDPNALAQRPEPDTTSNPPEGTLTPACMSCSDGRARGERRGGDALEDHDPATKPRTWVRISDRPGYRASVARRRDGCGQVISSCRRHSTHCIANDDGRGDPSATVHALHDRV